MHDTLIILAAYFVMAVLTVLGTVAATALFVPGGVATMRQARTAGVTMPQLPLGYLIANILVSLVAAMAAGMLITRYATPPQRRSVIGLCGFILLIGLSMALQKQRGGQPRWYPWVIPLVGVMGVWLGALIQSSAS